MSEYLLISDAAKEVQVESHVLRYWEEELHLPIKRNELGHRFYTREDVERFRQIKGLKERGLQLKAIKMILKEGRLDLISGLDESWLTGESGRGTAQDAQDGPQGKTGGDRPGEKPEEKRGEKRSAVQGEDRKEKPDGKQGKEQSEKSEGRSGEKSGKEQSEKAERKSGEKPGQEVITDPGRQPVNSKGSVEASSRKKVIFEEKTMPDENRVAESGRKNEPWVEGENEPAQRMGIEILESRDLNEVSRPNPEDRSRRLQWLLRQMMQEAVRENNEELCRSIKESVIKELDYQFRMQEERQEERDKENMQRGEEYYRRMDELLRQRSGRRKKDRQEPRKSVLFEIQENRDKRRQETENGPSAREEDPQEKAGGNSDTTGIETEQATAGETKTEDGGKKPIFRFWAPGRKTV